MRICICGGGNLGLVCAGYLGRKQDVDVVILTRNPSFWNHELEVVDPSNNIFRCQPSLVSAEAREIIPNSDLILLCLPGFAIEPTLKEIMPYVSGNTIIGSIVSSTGFFFMAHQLLPTCIPLFGFQRVPFIARTIEYGHKANLLGYKQELCIAVEGVSNKERFRKTIEDLFSTPTRLLNNYFEASLTNSNPILHTGRLYSMWSDWDGTAYEKPILFYKEWTDDASQVIIKMDKEFMQLVNALGITETAIPSLLTYYESNDSKSLTKKISSIPAFQHIIAPMRQENKVWVPDFESRYFTEDFPYGLKIIYELAKEKGIPCPNIEKIYLWGISKTAKFSSLKYTNP
ncbi:MAG: NAD/NADP octopine/nopaline dehydrogenase family protein [Bacteroidales bacterium]|nr:NAD/NADP octopine/nopaline dehydrogenase family protein [Bacteroidales bacterium]